MILGVEEDRGDKEESRGDYAGQTAEQRDQGQQAAAQRRAATADDFEGRKKQRDASVTERCDQQ